MIQEMIRVLLDIVTDLWDLNRMELHAASGPDAGWRSTMTREYMGRTFAALLFVAFLVSPSFARLTGVTGYAGNLGFSCGSCHDGGETPLVRLEGPRQVVAGERVSYRFTVESASSAQSFAGFDVAVSGGVLVPLAGEGSRSDNGELVHDAPKASARGQTSWEFEWRAPIAVGPQTLHASGLSANGNGQRTGDGFASTSLAIEVEAPPCLGDCNGDGRVSVGELVRGVRIALRRAEVDSCATFDRDGDGTVSIAEIIAAVQNALRGCGHEIQPTPTPSPEPTRRASPTPGICATPTAVPAGARASEWTTYAGTHARTFFNSRESRITRQNVSMLRPKWRYQTGAVVTASPTVAFIEVPGEGAIKIVITPSWDGNVYALRASNGTRLWHFPMKPHPGAAFPYAASAAVATVEGEQRIYVAGGMTMYCLSAASGELVWAFDAGTGCSDCDRRTERNEILSSATVADGKVFFGMDVNEGSPGKGGAFAVDAANGTLVWFFDLETQATCRPDAGDDVRRFDGFHSAEELGLPTDFFTTRDGCDFARSSTACGNIWSSFAVDEQRRALFIASSNCETDNDPQTVQPPPPMPAFDEAIFSLDFDGVPRWRWRPREIDNMDLAFGAVPNLFTAVIEGTPREVVGVGNKDGTYYVLDRDGVNQVSGVVEPYWQTKVVPGGSIGGIIATAAVGEGKVLFSTAIGFDLADPQRPAAWALDANTGDVLWSNPMAQPSYAPTSAIPGVVFMGSLFAGRVVAYDSESGEVLYRSPSLAGPVASAPAVVDGEVFIGGGVGTRGSPTSIAHLQSLVDSPIAAFCLPDACDCPTELCDDGDPCTYDFYEDNGACASEDAPDGLRCTEGEEEGTCRAGMCIF